MPSLRQRMTTYLRQLSFIAEPREESRIAASLSPRNRPDDGCFITRYLEGRMNKTITNETQIDHGKEPIDLPELQLLWYDTGTSTITAACTGPDEGLTGVKRSRLHLSAGPDIDFIDTVDHEPEQSRPTNTYKTKSFKLRAADQNANKPFARPQQRKLSSSSTSGSSAVSKATAEPMSTTKTEPKIEKATTINVVVSLISTTSAASEPIAKPQSLTLGTSTTVSQHEQQHSPDDDDTLNRNIESTASDQQMSLANDNVLDQGTPTAMELPAIIAGVSNWKLENDHAYGLSTSLYEKNYVTNEQVGNPVADCFGLVVRGNAAVMALADGVNWGEGARLAARSAVQGCLEYLDTAIFGQVPAGMASTTREVFVSLLRSFWEAHACILEVGGALSTLTVAVVLPLDDPHTGKHIVCACNVGDSLGYVYSKRHGVREITQDSHDIQSMRDMRDALGALGPVDGNKPELGNLTLSMTIVEAGDIVFLTSDGISDNFDPVVGKFAEAYTEAAAVAAQTTVDTTTTKTVHLDVQPQLAPRRQNKSASAVVSSVVTSAGRSDPTAKASHRFSLQSSTVASSKHNSKQKSDTTKPPVRPPRANNKKTSSSLSTTTNANIVATSTAIAAPTSSRPKFMRSHTVIEPRTSITANAATPSIKLFPKSATGLPLVTGPQRHMLTLLRLEDLLCFGINGTLRPCPSARKLCHLLIDFARMITSARRNILEQRELYYRIATDHTGQRREIELNRLQQRAARKRVVDGTTFLTLPGKLDHATVVAYTVGSALKTRSPLARISVFSETDF